jgi:porin
MKKQIVPHVLMALFLAISLTAVESSADSKINPRLSPDEVENQIALDREANPLYESEFLAPVHEWKNEFAERTGFNWNIDYFALFMGVSDSLGEDQASSGVVRFFGYWDLVNRGAPNKGSLNWKIENRHKYSDIPPSGLGFESGYVGLF